MLSKSLMRERSEKRCLFSDNNIFQQTKDTKPMSLWSPEEVVFWLCVEVDKHNYDFETLFLSNFRCVDGNTLLNMTLNDFIQKDKQAGNLLYQIVCQYKQNQLGLVNCSKQLECKGNFILSSLNNIPLNNTTAGNQLQDPLMCVVNNKKCDAKSVEINNYLYGSVQVNRDLFPTTKKINDCELLSNDWKNFTSSITVQGKLNPFTSQVNGKKWKNKNNVRDFTSQMIYDDRNYSMFERDEIKRYKDQNILNHTSSNNTAIGKTSQFANEIKGETLNNKSDKQSFVPRRNTAIGKRNSLTYEFRTKQWNNKAIISWTTEDVANWICEETLKHHYDYENICWPNIHGINGSILLNMNKRDFCSYLSGKIGYLLFLSLTKLKNNKKNGCRETEKCVNSIQNAKNVSGPKRKHVLPKRKSLNRNKREQLWIFLRNLLENPKYCPKIVCWENQEKGMFRFVDTRKVAELWGSQGQKPNMSYDIFTRAIRYYYKKNILLPVRDQRVYKFGPSSWGWKPKDSANNELSSD